MLNQVDKDALLQFLKDWAKPMVEIFNARFGKNKIGYILIGMSTDNEPTVSYTTNLREADFKRAMRLLADKLNDSRIIKLDS